MRKVLEIDNNEIRKKKETIKMAKVKTFKTIFPAVSVPLNDDYSINEPEFRAYLRWIKTFYGKGMDGLVCNGHTGEITGLTRAERKRVVEICAEECGDVMTIISGVNCENTAESIEMAKEAKEALASNNVNPVLKWVSVADEPAIIALFKKTYSLKNGDKQTYNIVEQHNRKSVV